MIKEEVKKFEKKSLAEMDFNLSSVEIFSSKEELSFLESSMDSVVGFTNQVDLSFRRQKAKLISYKFAWDLWDKISLWKILTFSFSENDLRSIAVVPINVSSNQEYADVAGYGAELYDYFCKMFNDKQKTENLKRYCSKVKDLNYFTLSPLIDSNDLDKLNLKLALKNDKVFKSESELKVNVNCLSIQDKELPFSIPISLSYNPQKNKSAKILINDFEFKIFPKNMINFGEKSEEAIIATFYEENEEIKVKYDQKTKELNYINPDSVEDVFGECDTLQKMASKRCEDYFEKILSSKK